MFDSIWLDEPDSSVLFNIRMFYRIECADAVYSLQSIQNTIGGRMSLALHGTSGVPDELLLDCLSHGVSKVNVNKVYLQYYTAHLKAHASSMPLTQLMEEGVLQVQRGLEPVIDACLSAGKAGSEN
jgi:fructose-bisphosphate aldolase class II